MTSDALLNRLCILIFISDALALYVESMAGNYETKTVPAPMEAFANKQIPYQEPAAAPAAVPAAAPMAAVPAVTQQTQEPQKPVTQENNDIKVEGKRRQLMGYSVDA